MKNLESSAKHPFVMKDFASLEGAMPDSLYFTELGRFDLGGAGTRGAREAFTFITNESFACEFPSFHHEREFCRAYAARRLLVRE